MGINAGNKMQIRASKTAITTYTEANSAVIVKNLGNFDNSVERAEIETTSFGDTFTQFIAGIKTGSLSLSGVLNSTDPGQKIVIDEYNDNTGAGIYLAVWENATENNCTVYHVYVSKLGKKAEANGKQELSLEFKLMEEPKALKQ